jgi:hypothetical protein
MKIRKETYGSLAAALGALLTTWNSNHLAALLAMATFGALALGIELHSEGWGNTPIIVFCAACYLAAWVIFQIVGPIPPIETDREVYLTAGNKPTPNGGCDSAPKNIPNAVSNPQNIPVASRVPKNAIAFFLGSNEFWTTGDFHNNILTLDNQPVISMRKTELGLLFSVEMFDPERKLVAKISSNKSILVPNNYSYKLRPDQSILSLYNDHDEEILYIQYLNRHDVVIRGLFTGQYGTSIRITDDWIIGTKGQAIGGSCLENMPEGLRMIDDHIKM